MKYYYLNFKYYLNIIIVCIYVICVCMYVVVCVCVVCVCISVCGCVYVYRIVIKCNLYIFYKLQTPQHSINIVTTQCQHSVNVLMLCLYFLLLLFCHLLIFFNGPNYSLEFVQFLVELFPFIALNLSLMEYFITYSIIYFILFIYL